MLALSGKRAGVYVEGDIMVRSWLMPIEQILALLIAERDRLNAAIEALQGARRRGRPPKNPLLAIHSAPAKKRRGMSAANRKAAAARMRAYWAKKRKAG
jgi:hypothetical protein